MQWETNLYILSFIITHFLTYHSVSGAAGGVPGAASMENVRGLRQVCLIHGVECLGPVRVAFCYLYVLIFLKATG